MRSMAVAVAILALGLVPARAGVVEFTYSGVIGTGLGVLTAGETVSGVAVWDSTNFSTNACPGNSAYVICLPLITDILNVSGSSGLSIPGGTVSFAGIPEVTEGVFQEIQINDESPVDSHVYSFFIGPGAIGVEEFTTAGLIGSATLTAVQTTGPTPVPEPGAITLLACPLGLVALAAVAVRRRRISRITPSAA